MKKLFFVAIFSFSLVSHASSSYADYAIVTSDNAFEKINAIIAREVKPNRALQQGALIDRVSSAFLGVPYVADTLVGGPEKPEALVINLEGVDCFTYLDYVIALTKSLDASDFVDALVSTRYKDSNVAYYNRKHFFTDWYALSPLNAIDVTATLSPNAVAVEKQLNQQANGDEYIKGLGPIARRVTYIPGDLIDQQVLDNMLDGDLVGIYTPLSGLDVTHTGFVIKKEGEVFYRNASSLSMNNKVVDAPFIEYMRDKPGIIVLRTLE